MSQAVERRISSLRWCGEMNATTTICLTSKAFSLGTGEFLASFVITAPVYSTRQCIYLSHKTNTYLKMRISVEGIEENSET